MQHRQIGVVGARKLVRIFGIYSRSDVDEYLKPNPRPLCREPGDGQFVRTLISLFEQESGCRSNFVRTLTNMPKNMVLEIVQEKWAKSPDFISFRYSHGPNSRPVPPLPEGSAKLQSPTC
jgi:hypothetical protein